jgi:hypothetical protein
MYTLGVIIPQFTSLFVLLFLLFFTYAVYGVLFLRGLFDSVLQAAAPEANFNSLTDAFLCLFQLFAGQGVSSVLCKFFLVFSVLNSSRRCCSISKRFRDIDIFHFVSADHHNVVCECGDRFDSYDISKDCR